MFLKKSFPISDEYIKELFYAHGYGKSKISIRNVVKILKGRGFIPHKYALMILRDFGGVSIDSIEDDDHNAVLVHFDPLCAIAFETDIRRYCSESIFPIGILFDEIIYVSSTHKFYSSNGYDYYFWGDSIETFLLSVFRKDKEGPQLLHRCSTFLDDHNKRKVFRVENDNEDTFDGAESDFMADIIENYRQSDVDSISDDYIIELFNLREHGYDKSDVENCVQILKKQGFIPNDYALSIIEKYGGFSINSRGDDEHYGVQLSFDPLLAADGMFGKEWCIKRFCSEPLFPIALLFDDIVYVSSSHLVFSSNGISCSYWGGSIESFLLSVFRKDARGRTILYDHNKEQASDQILLDIESFFPWLDISDAKNDFFAVGFPDILINKYVFPEFVRVFEDAQAADDRIKTFFDYIEKQLRSTNLEINKSFKQLIISNLFYEKINQLGCADICGEKTKSLMLKYRD